MTEKEFRKLKALDLIQILLTQTNEVTAQQEELERKNMQMEWLLSENEIIKAKLNDRDAMTELIKAKLNDSDERIRELEKEVKSLYSDRIIELEDAGSLVQAALELNKIFEAAQREAEIYLYGAKRGIRGVRYDTLGMSESFRESMRSGMEEEQLLTREPAAKEQPLIKESAVREPLTDKEAAAKEPLTDEPAKPDRVSPADSEMMYNRISPADSEMMYNRVSPAEEKTSWEESSPEEKPAAEAVSLEEEWNKEKLTKEELAKEEPAKEELVKEDLAEEQLTEDRLTEERLAEEKPVEEEPPGLEAFNWRFDEKKTEESAAAPTAEPKAEQVEIETAVEPPKKSEGSRLKGLFGFFKRKKR